MDGALTSCCDVWIWFNFHSCFAMPFDVILSLLILLSFALITQSFFHFCPPFPSRFDTLYCSHEELWIWRCIRHHTRPTEDARESLAGQIEKWISQAAWELLPERPTSRFIQLKSVLLSVCICVCISVFFCSCTSILMCFFLLSTRLTGSLLNLHSLCNIWISLSLILKVVHFIAYPPLPPSKLNNILHHDISLLRSFWYSSITPFSSSSFPPIFPSSSLSSSSPSSTSWSSSLPTVLPTTSSLFIDHSLL